MYNILIIEDEIKLRDELRIFLENNGYTVNYVIDFKDVLEIIQNNNYDLILLDINLPNINGEYLCKEIRKFSSIPIIIVTSKNTIIDEVVSINYGADDFITKPYNVDVLLARIERLLQRVNNSDNVIKYLNLELNVSKGIIMVNNKVMDLSKNEIKILYFLLKRKGSIVSRDEIINYLWDNEAYVDDNTLTVNINRLRNKLNNMGTNDIIKTKRGIGYIIL